MRLLGDTALGLQRYPEARKLYEDSLAIHREFDHRSGIVLALGGLGEVGIMMDDFNAAREWLHEGYTLASAIRDTPLTLWILARIAGLLAKEGASESSLEIISLVLNHYAAPQEARDKAEAVLAELHGSLSARDELATALERGEEFARQAEKGQVGVDENRWLALLL